MQKRLETPGPHPELVHGALAAAMASNDEPGIDPMTLAKLDIGLFRALQNLGTDKQRICSALCLSYAEHDYILELLQTPE